MQVPRRVKEQGDQVFVFRFPRNDPRVRLREIKLANCATRVRDKPSPEIRHWVVCFCSFPTREILSVSSKSKRIGRRREAVRFCPWDRILATKASIGIERLKAHSEAIAKGSNVVDTLA